MALSPTEEVASLISDNPAAASKIQHFLDAIYRDGNTQLVDNSLFSTYSSGGHRYLIAKTYITFYNENARQQIRGILMDVDSGWTFSISPEQLAYFVRTGDRTLTTDFTDYTDGKWVGLWAGNDCCVRRTLRQMPSQRLTVKGPS